MEPDNNSEPDKEKHNLILQTLQHICFLLLGKLGRGAGGKPESSVGGRMPNFLSEPTAAGANLGETFRVSPLQLVVVVVMVRSKW